MRNGGGQTAGEERRLLGSGVRRVLRWVLLGLALLALLPLLLTAVYALVPAPSTLMLQRWVLGQPVQWRPVALTAMSPHLISAVTAAEDARFCSHDGVDWEVLRMVLEDADEAGPARGASTIPMQTAKNLFLWHGRSYLRKGLELPLALLIDLAWSKPRLLETYLNMAEWGEGVFGAEAAAQALFRKPALALTLREASLLAAALPNPLARNAARPTAGLAARARTIAARAQGMGGYLGCLGQADPRFRF
jgi:monofunctional biosynthetic peptidoglycan transglycosylase